MHKLLIFILIIFSACQKVEFQIKNTETGEKLQFSSLVELTSNLSEHTNQNEIEIELTSSRDLQQLAQEYFLIDNAQIQSINKIESNKAKIVISPISNGKIRVSLSEIGKKTLLGSLSKNIEPFEITFDDVSPVVSLSHSLGANTNLRSWIVDINVNEKITELSLNDFTLNNCEISAINKVSDGLYRISVNALNEGSVSININDGAIIDIAGNQSGPISGLTTTFDETIPVVSISDLSKINITNKSSYDLSGSCSESSNVSVVIGSLNSIDTNCVSGGWQLVGIDVSSLADSSSIIVTASQTDLAGNIGTASSSASKDIIPPSVTINVPSNPTNNSSITVSVTFSEQIEGLIEGDFTLSNATILSSSLSTSDNINFSLTINPDSEGTVSVELLAAVVNDLVGNNSLASSQESFIFDQTPPTVSIDSAPDVSISNLSSYTVSGSCSEDGRDVSLNIGSVGINVACSSGQWIKSNLDLSSFALSEGILNVTVEQTDAAGNQSIQVSQSVVKDTLAPTVTISSPANINLTNHLSYSLSGTCSELGISNVDILFSSQEVGETDTASISVDCNSGSWNLSLFDVSIIAQGNALVEVSQTDGVGNTSIENQNIFKDTIAPYASLDFSPSISSPTSASLYSVSLTFSEIVAGLSTSDFTVDNGLISNLYTNDGGLTYGMLLIPIAQGEVSLNLGAGLKQDSYGNDNLASNLLSLTYDETPPSVSIDAIGNILDINKQGYVVSGSCDEEGSIVSVSVGGVSPSTNPTCSSSAFSVSLDVSSISDNASVLVSISQTDAAGNTGSDTLNVLKDTIIPLLTIDPLSTPIIATTTNYTFSGTCSEIGENVVVKVSGLTSTISCLSDSTWTTTLDISSEVPNISLSAEHVDINGNIALVSITEFFSIPQNFDAFTELATNQVNGIFLYNSEIYAATNMGLSISYDGGSTFTSRTTANGLGSNYVKKVIKTNDGKIFVATTSGLSISTNGAKSFVNKAISEGLAGNTVNAVAMNDSNILFVATSGGLSISNDFGNAFTSIGSPTIANNLVNNVFVKGNKVYLATNGGISVSSDNGTTFSNFTSFVSNITLDVFETNDGTIYVSTSNGLAVSVDGGTSFTNITTGLASSYVRSFIKDEVNDVLYVATSNGLSVSYDGGLTFTTKNNVNGLGSKSISDLALKSNSDLYTANGQDFFYVGGISYSTDQGNSFSTISSANGLASYDVRDVFVDSSGNIYVSTWKGLSISEDGGVSFYTYTDVDGLGNKNTYKSFVHNGVIYAATSNGLTIISDDGNGGKTFVTKKTTNGLGSNTVRDVYVDTIDSLTYVFVATDGGVSISSDGGNSFVNNINVFGIGKRMANSVYAKKIGSNINVYATAYDTTNLASGLAVSEDGGATYTKMGTAEGLAGVYTSDVFVDSSNKIYVATSGGVSVITDYGLGSQTIQNSNTTNGLPHINAKSICVSPSGVMFVATQSGLSVSSNDGTSYIVKNEKNGLADGFIKNVFCDSTGNIFTIGGSGLSKSTGLLSTP